MRYLIAIAMVLMFTEIGFAAELTQNEPDRTRGWQDREYFGRAYAEKELAGGDGPTSGEAAAEGASAGATGGNGDGCGPK